MDLCYGKLQSEKGEDGAECEGPKHGPGGVFTAGLEGNDSEVGSRAWKAAHRVAALSNLACAQWGMILVSGHLSY